MAKYKLNPSGTHTAECDILNETDNSYVVRFKNGSISEVSKNRIRSLNEMDNAVLDYARKGMEGISRFGKNVVDKFKNTASSVGNFILNVINAGKRIFFKDGDNTIIKSVHPVNTMIRAMEGNNITFIPSSDTVNVCNELGIQPRASYGYQFKDDKYTGSYVYDEKVKKILNSSDVYSPVTEGFHLNEDGSRTEAAVVRERLYLDSDKFEDYDTYQCIEYIKNAYYGFIENYDDSETNPRLEFDRKVKPLMMLGAPGVAKTSIIRALGKELDIPVLTINAGAVESEMFTMPAVDDFVENIDSDPIEWNETNKFKVFSNKKIADLPKSWMPVYDTNMKDIEPSKRQEVLKKRKWVADGGILDDDGNCIGEAKGGILFIDEFLRMSREGHKSLFDFPLNRYFGSVSNLVLGDRWVIVAASNRYEDVNAEEAEEMIKGSIAFKTRFAFRNFIPSKEMWIDWGSLPIKDAKYPFSNVNRNIREFVDRNSANYYSVDPKDRNITHGDPHTAGMFYDVEKDDDNGDGFSTKSSHAMPRTWEQLSTIIWCNHILKKNRQCIENGEEPIITNDQDKNDDLILLFIKDRTFKSDVYGEVGTVPGNGFINFLLGKLSFSGQILTDILSGTFIDGGGNVKKEFKDKIQNFVQTIVDVFVTKTNNGINDNTQKKVQELIGPSCQYYNLSNQGGLSVDAKTNLVKFCIYLENELKKKHVNINASSTISKDILSIFLGQLAYQGFDGILGAGGLQMEIDKNKQKQNYTSLKQCWNTLFPTSQIK